MKLFISNDSKVREYFKKAITDNSLELELIFGSHPGKNPIDKKIFLKVLDHCNSTFKKVSETVDLDVRTQYKQNVSSVRATIHGLDSIKKYCKDNKLIDVHKNIDFIEKKNIIDGEQYTSIKDYNFNVRINLKQEIELRKTHHYVKSYLTDIDSKNKHFRYKKRFSFITDDQLFRIDLTIVKSTSFHKGRYNFRKSFKEANILNNPEIFELEIEYLGWKGNTGAADLDSMFQKLNEVILSTESIQGFNGNIYDPFNIGIPIKEIDYYNQLVSETENAIYELDSPKYKEENPTLLMNYNDESTIRYSYDDYRMLQGKFTRIKKEYFEENNIDIRIHETLEEYYRLNIQIGIISDIHEELEYDEGDESKMEYKDTIVTVNLSPSIGDMHYLYIPLKYIYGGYYSIEEQVIKEKFNLDDKEAILHKKEEIEDKEQLKDLVKSEDEELSELAGNILDQKGGAGEDNELIHPIIDKLFDILENNVIHLSKVVQESDKLISYRLKESVIEKYKKITDQKARYFTFIGPQPKTLNMDCIGLGNPKSIIIDYAVTEKADGERYQLFIHEKIGYLINSKQNVIDTGCMFKYVEGDWILDGEYITKDKYNQPIRKFMIFDVYWCGLSGIPQDAHTYPFLSRDPYDSGSRYEILKTFKKLITEKVGDDTTKEKDIESSNVEELWMSKLNKNLKSKMYNIDVSQSLTEEEREEYIQYLNDNQIEPIINYGKDYLTVDVKEYQFGYQTKTNEDKINLDSLQKNDITKIFKVSKNILTKDSEGYYEYRIDGLIYLPTRLSVNGSIEGFQSKKIHGTWPLNYKWKPPHENTIDFKIKIKKEMTRGKLIDKVFPYVAYNEDGSKKSSEYKQIELYVGYKECEDKSINYCMKVMMDDNVLVSNNDLQLFNVNSPEDERYNITNIPLTDGKLLCDNFEKDEIKDGDIVEMRFNRSASDSMYWEPVRVRSDKLKPQFFDIAYDVWDTINRPITTSRISGDDFVKNKVDIYEETSGKYYVNEDNNILSDSEKLRKFHNFVKSKLIGGVLSSFNRKVKVMDLSCGQGGDINKFVNHKSNVSLLVGIDISSNIHEACRRFYCNRGKYKTKGIFFRGDTSKNIKNGDSSTIQDGDKNDQVHAEAVTRILYNQKGKIPNDYKGVINRYLGLANDGFDIVNSQFSLHYYFKNKETFDGLIGNLKDNIKKGGYFIGTCYDGKKIFDYFQEREKLFQKIKDIEEEGLDEFPEEEDSSEEEDDDEEELLLEGKKGESNVFTYTDRKGNIVFSIEKEYGIDTFDYDSDDLSNIFGNQIKVFMDSIGQVIPEYLVNFEYLKDTMEKNGFEVSIPNVKTNHHIFRKDYFENGFGQFKTIISKLKEISFKDKDLKKLDPNGNNIAYYRDALDMQSSEYYTDPLVNLSSFNNYFIFKRV